MRMDESFSDDVDEVIYAELCDCYSSDGKVVFHGPECASLLSRQ